MTSTLDIFMLFSLVMIGDGATDLETYPTAVSIVIISQVKNIILENFLINVRSKTLGVSYFRMRKNGHALESRFSVTFLVSCASSDFHFSPYSAL